MLLAKRDSRVMTARYITATIAHVWKDMNVFATTFLAVFTSSGKPMTDRIDVSLSVITNWKEVGGADEKIVAYQRNEGSGSLYI